MARVLTREENTLLLLALFCQITGKLYDLDGIPRVAEGISPLLPPDESEDCFFLRTLMDDGVAALCMMAQGLKQGPLETLIQGLPRARLQNREIACRAQDKGRILRALCDQETQPHTMNDGLRVRHETGYATIVPDAYRGLVRVSAESGDAETARELCDFYQKKIEALTASPLPVRLKKPVQ